MATVLKWNGAALLAYGRKAASNAIKAAGTEHLRIAHQMASVPNTGVTVETAYGKFRKRLRKAVSEIRRIKDTHVRAREMESLRGAIGGRNKAFGHVRANKRLGEQATRLTARRQTLKARKASLAAQRKRTRAAIRRRKQGGGFF